MPITFAVDEVEPAAAPAPTVGLRELIGPHLHLGIEGDPQVLEVGDAPPLLAGIHHAFAEHRPLVLSPDAVWLTIAQGVAHHVRLNAEALRPRFVRHAGREVLTIVATAEPGADAWSSLIAGFRAMIGERVGEGIGRLMTCDFSTSGAVERTASEIVLMDMMSPYFDYRVACVCGIPSITLLGTPADWRAIRARIDVIAELDLGWWTSSLAPIADRLVAAAEGRPDAAFFRDIYKPQRAYGWDRIAGWSARFYPYVEREGRYDQRNSLLAVPLDAPLPAAEHGMYGGPGIALRDAPRHLAQALVRVHPGDGAPARLVVLEGGLIAVEQDAAGALIPRIGYVVREGGTTVGAVIERIRAAHATVAGSDPPGWTPDGALRALFAAIGEATLFADAQPWHLLPPAARARVTLVRAEHRDRDATRVVDLPDGTTLALAELGHETRVVRLRVDALVPIELPETVVDEVTGLTIRTSESRFHQDLPRWQTTEPAAAIPVLDGSLIELLDRALASGGSLELPSTGSVVEHEPDLWDTAVHAGALLDRLRRDHPIVEGERGLFGSIAGGEIVVGDQRWAVLPERTFAVRGESSSGYVHVVLALPDGTALGTAARSLHRCVVQLRRDQLEERLEQPAKKKRAAVYTRVSSQPPDSMPVLGRSLVDVLEHALATGALPAARETFADWLGRDPR